uniref:Ig-like domain-containing protein n=1 Tax=Myotis lucifugus TaxID=59463 RepID=G1NX23_MYOLU
MRLLLLLLPVLRGGALAKDSSYWLEPQESVSVQESLCVFVPCKFSDSWSISGPPYLYWFKKEGNKRRGLLVATDNPKEELQETIQGRFLLPVDPKSSDCSLTIRDVNKRDSGTYFFYLKYGRYEHTYRDTFFTLKVTALTDKPDIQIPGPLESGRPKKLNCYVPWACEEGTPPIFSWTSAAYTSLDPRSHHLSSVLTLTPRPQDHGTNLTCQVYFPATGVSVERTIRLNVAYAPQNMAIHVFQGNSTALKILKTTSLSILEGEALRLLCEADSNPPAKLSWFRGSPGLHATPLSSTAILELPRVVPAQEGEFTCQARHLLGFQSVSLSLSVVYPPQLLGPLCSWEDQGLSEGLRLSCEARNVHGTRSTAVLLLPGQDLLGAEATEEGTLGPPGMQMEQEGEFICRAQNLLGSLLVLPSLSVHYPPQLLGPSCSWEDQDLFCSCSSRAQPAPSLRWRLGAGLLEGNHSNASHAVTSSSEGPWTNSSLSLRVGLSSDLRLSCEAWNVLGAQSASVLRLPGKPESRARGVLGVVGGAGILALALLSLCLCLICRVKTCREKAAQLMQSMDKDMHPGAGTGSGVSDAMTIPFKISGLVNNKTPTSPNLSLALGGSLPDPSEAHQHPFWTDSSAAPPTVPPAPGGAGPPAKGEPELHYAFVRFHNRKPQGNEDANIVYSEIKTH